MRKTRKNKNFFRKNKHLLQSAGYNTVSLVNQHIVPKNLAIIFTGRIKGYTEVKDDLLNLKNDNNGTVFCSLNKQNKSDYIKTFCEAFGVKDEQINLEITPPTPEYMNKHPNQNNFYSQCYHLKKAFNMLKIYQKN